MKLSSTERKIIEAHREGARIQIQKSFPSNASLESAKEWAVKFNPEGGTMKHHNSGYEHSTDEFTSWSDTVRLKVVKWNRPSKFGMEKLR